MTKSKSPGKASYDYDLVLPHAQDLARRLAPACERLAIAGSLRRHKATVGDIELVALPRYQFMPDLFGAPGQRISEVDLVLEALHVEVAKNGERQKEFTWRGFQVDLFLPAGPECWGVIYTLRTGSSDFSRWLVTQRSAGGALPAGMRVSDGRIWRGEDVIETPEERDVFEALGLAYVPPEQRERGRWTKRPAWNRTGGYAG